MGNVQPVELSGAAVGHVSTAGIHNNGVYSTPAQPAPPMSDSSESQGESQGGFNFDVFGANGQATQPNENEEDGACRQQ